MSPHASIPYAELHAHSHFSFLDGVSSPEDLAAEAARLELDALALTDHDGMYGAVRFAAAAAEHGLRTVFGAELSVGNAAGSADSDISLPGNSNPPHTTPSRAAARTGVPDPPGDHLLILARNTTGYSRLCQAISTAQLDGGEKGRPRYDLDQLAELAWGSGQGSTRNSHWLVLTGCRKGAVRAALDAGGMPAAERALSELIERFGRENVVVELTDHGHAVDSTRNDALAELARAAHLSTVATTGAHLARPEQSRLASTVAGIRANSGLEELAGWLPAWSGAYLRSGNEQARRFARYPGAVERAAELGRECAFELHSVDVRLPPFSVPEGLTESAWLRELTHRCARSRYGSPDENSAAYQQLDHELAIIEKLDFPGYFLIVHDIVEFCRRSNILCQGRGSAANSAVCYALRITNADPVRYQLLFERFLAPEREGPPDIDLDIESDRREEVIQYVYEKYGRSHAAQVANVISYRPKSAVRDVARIFRRKPEDIWPLAQQLVGAPRHLGIHSGGMVISHQPVSQVCPVEWARMPGRSVLQWDKDDCAAIGLVKFDLLGLGMLSALHYAIDLVAEYYDIHVDLGQLNLADDEVYAMLRAADAIGVFQVESRAQLATLPRLKPREFYDLVVEVGLIRPGPIQGGSVHPYIQRRNGAAWDYEHPLMAGALARTLGVPLFQEQMMQLAVDVAGFTPAQADALRRAMGAKRSRERIARLREELFAGMARNGITGSLADRIYERMLAFADYGFPESHALSFALLVFGSAWFKRYYPAVFCAALLKAQPMGFYSPQSLTADARRHGVRVFGPSINASRTQADLEPDAESTGGHAVRLGLSTVRNLGEERAERIVRARPAGGYSSMTEIVRCVSQQTGTRLEARQLESLATAGAFDCLGLSRRAALWQAATAAQDHADLLPGTTVSAPAPALPGMNAFELAAADVWASGVAPEGSPLRLVRSWLRELGALSSAELSDVEHGQRVTVGGIVTHRQRPGTARGVVFINLEDETGMTNVVCSPGLWQRYRTIGSTSPALLVRGVVERADSTAPESPVINLRADKLEPLQLRVPTTGARDFR